MINKSTILIFPFLIISTIVYISGCSPTVNQNPTGSVSPSAGSIKSSSPPVSPTNNPSTVISPTPVPPQSNLTVGAKIVDSFYINYGPSSIIAGTKWEYNVTSKVGSYTNNPTVTSIEIESINGIQLTLKITAAGFVTETTTNNVTKPVIQGQQNLDFTYQGTEDVTVPAGTYTGTIKITGNYDSNGAKTVLTYWFAQGVGAVKILSVSTSSSIDVTTTSELKDFTN